MNPDTIRKRVKDFLISKTTIKKDILRNIAEIKLRQISNDLGKDTQNASLDNVEQFIVSHYTELTKEADKVIDDLCKEILPEKQWHFIVKQFSILSIFFHSPSLPTM